PLYGLAALAVAIGLVMLRRAEHVTDFELHAAVAIGSLVLAVTNYFGGAGALYPIMFSWAALYAFYFFSLRAALWHMALIAASYAAVLVVQDPASPVIRWILAMGTPLVAGLLISHLLGRAAREAATAAERARVLRQSEAGIRAIVESAPDAFVTIEVDGRVANWNHEAERTFGIAAADAIGRDIGELIFDDEGRPAHEERRRVALRGSDSAPTRSEVELVRRDGTRFPAEITVSRVHAEDRVMLAAFIRDISYRLEQERERAELVREQAAREELEQMARIIQGLQVLLDAALAHNRLDQMLDALAPRVREVLSAEVATILLAEEDGSLVLRASTAGFPEGGPLRVPPGAGLAGRVAASGEPLVVHDPAPEDVVDPALRKVQSILGVPLLAGGSVTGVIQVGVSSPRRFSDEDLLVLKLAADRVALAVDHARVYEREHQIAETLQRSLLPERLPALPGLEVAARYLPAASEAEVGGDWYDVIPISSGVVGLVMGDVAGKGLVAASMVGRLRSAMRAYALEGHDPPTVIDRLNQLVWSEHGDSEMATLLYVVVDSTENALTWVNAGHLPPLVVGRDGLARFLEGPRSVPLGVQPFPCYEQAGAQTEPGSTLLLYTDGLVERPGELLDHGLARLTSALQGANGRPEDMLDDVLEALVPEGAASDDIALLALHCPMLSERLRVELPGDPAELASMRALLRRWLRHAGGTARDVGEILTATGEAASNAIEHAGAPAPSPLEVVGTVAGREVEITVRDYGRWRPERADERGRGLLLMRALMDTVEVTPSPEGTTVRLRRRLSDG
ncbi:MAG: SpoIIE family protein phosphatase, partial [Actinomycetota bacterium]|nr:SpoIIE family protein phosphatase [Actinomycetota bacterium]